MPNRPTLDARLLSADPIIEGRVIGDPIWDAIEPIETMTQIKPHVGKPATENTSIRVAYTSKVFYVAVVCYDSDPKKIVVSDSRRDADLTDDDSFLFIVDTYNDTQNGFLFGTNADGMEYDAQIDNEGKGNNNTNRQQGGVIGGINLNWDAKWIVKTHKGDYGWSAEFAIPFSSLRFSAGDNQTWGINFERNISKNTETAYWASIPIGFDLKRLSLAGQIHGMKLVNPGNLKVMPYVLAHVSNGDVDGKNITDSGLDAGVDVKYSITPSVTLDLSYNTDFAQVEVDDEQVNLDRFNLFFPEKRPFFLENAGQFTVGTPGEVDLFFSRRIGIGANGNLVPIIGGARVSGKIGQTNVGMLSMFTDEVAESGIDKNSFNMLRVNQDFPKNRSSIGAVFVNRTGLGDATDDFNHVYALDGKWGLGQKAQVFGFVAKSVTPGIDGQDHALKLHCNYNWQKWEFRTGYSEVGEGFNPEVGFLQRSAFRKPEIFGLYRWRPDNLLNLLELRPHISYRGYWDFNGQLITGYLHIDNHWQWRSGFEVHTGINYTTEGVVEDFNLSGVVVKKETYKHKELQVVVMTNQNKAVSFNTQMNIGGYFGGNRIATRTSIKARIGDKFASAITLNHNDLDLPNGSLTAFVFGTRLSYSFTPRMFVQSLIQYNNRSKITSVNARFGWLQNANNGLFVVFNIVKDQTFEETLSTESIRVKYTRSFDLMRS
ncbi:MAG: DUF5916 domain-containing protein [Saprospiraceae bacterium]